MRPTIPLLVVGLSLATFGGWSGVRAYAAEESKDLPAPSAARQAGITRVAIAISGGPVAYTDQFRENPPAIVIEFRSRNVKAQLEPLVAVNAGLIKAIQSDYYPPGRRVLKSLTLTLAQPAAYAIAQRASQIVIDIETPSGLLPGRMAIGGLTILGMEARETLISRLKAMGDALQQAAPPLAPVSATLKPVVVTKPVEIPQSLPEPKPVPMPGPTKGVRDFWLGLLLGIGGSLIAVAGRRRRRKAVVVPGAPAEVAPMAWGASVYEGLILKAVQRQGQKLISSKAIEGLGTVWIIEKEGSRRGLICLIDGEFFDRKVLEQFLEALKQETLPSGTAMALGAFTAPAQAFAKECGIALVAREEALRMISVELKTPALEPEAAAHLARVEGELVQAQERIRHVEQELAEKVELYAKLSQETDQLKAKSAEADQHLAAEQDKRAQLERQIAQLEAQIKAQAAAASPRSEKEQLVQELTHVAKEAVKEAGVEEEEKASQAVERRKQPRLDLAAREGKGILVRATSNDGEPMNGDARNISAGGLCVELPSGERLAEEFELKLFLPDRTKPIEAIGKLIWKGRGSRRRMEQLGVALSAINAPDQEAISQFVEERKPELVPIG